MEKENFISSQNKCCILLFVKYPKAGAVKRRLAEAIGRKKAAQLYERLAIDTIDCVKQLSFPFEILYWPGEYGTQFAAVFGSEHIYVAQQGRDLSQRLVNAFNHAFGQGFEYAIALGSDSPDLPAQFIKDAFGLLETNDAVIGPASDGGYYLVGFSKNSFTPAAFENIPWSSPEVLAQTILALKNQNKTISLLPPWYDIDTIDDLRRFAQRNHSSEGSRRVLRTLSYVSKEIPSLNGIVSGD
jgi:rSAM/selenodomain-associated transferase 1